MTGLDDALDGTTAHVPDGSPLSEALARTTDLGVVAHPDDLELAMPGPILACAADPDRWFTGIVCTDGAGAPQPTSPPGVTPPDLVARRAAEQRSAAELGGYSAVFLLGRSSQQARGPGRAQLAATLEFLLRAAGAARVLTHNPLDRHPTHVAVATSVIDAARALPQDRRPEQLLGCEAWRDLDWLGADERVELPVTNAEDAALELARCFASQLEAKRYDLAAQGRRRANATFAHLDAADAHTEVSLAVDLTGALDESADPAAFVLGLVDRFRSEAAAALEANWPRRPG